jgi:hypothetical protein
MKHLRVGLFTTAIALVSASLLPAASISLDTVGADPDLTSPAFSFQIDQGGGFDSTYHNVSNPPFDFVTLTLTAPFTPAFYGQINQNTCSGAHIFNTCSITSYDSIFTVVFVFSGLDDTHFGIPYNSQFPVAASSFEPGQTVTGAASQATATPEPAALALTSVGLGGLVVGRKKFLKLGIRA